MTGAIHHGNPGSFKSFTVVQNVVIPALLKGRTVVTNINGLNSIEKIEKAMEIKIPDEAQLIYVDQTEKGFIAMRVWFHWVPLGALIAMDETQKIYSKKRHRDLKPFDLKLTDAAGELRPVEDIKKDCPFWDGDFERPDAAETAIDMHRHYNWDIYCTTPNISKVHPEIRESFEVAYRHRALGALVPWWKNKWKEFTHDPEVSGKSLSHYMGSPKRYEADVRVFKCYKSTKTGKALGTSEARPIYRDPKLQLVVVGLLVLLGFFIYSTIQALENGTILSKGSKNSPGKDGAVSSQGVLDAGGDADSSDADAVRLAAVFDALEPKKEKQEDLKLSSYQSIEGLSGFLGQYIERGYTMRLSAYVKRSDDSIVFQILVMDEEALIDRVTDKDIKTMGYQYSYDDSGLQVASDSEAFLIRPLGYFVLPKSSYL